MNYSTNSEDQFGHISLIFSINHFSIQLLYLSGNLESPSWGYPLSLICLTTSEFHTVKAVHIFAPKRKNHWDLASLLP